MLHANPSAVSFRKSTCLSCVAWPHRTPCPIAPASVRSASHDAPQHKRNCTVQANKSSSQPAPAAAAVHVEAPGHIPPFHIAFPVRDVEEARQFYIGVLGCTEGRSASTWVDFNLYGHQIVAHLVKGYNAASTANAVDGDPVPVPHFGVALCVPQFHALAERLKALPGFTFVIQPHLRFQGKPGEQWTMFFKDPSNNALEFKAMTNPANLFAKYTVNE